MYIEREKAKTLIGSWLTQSGASQPSPCHGNADCWHHCRHCSHRRYPRCWHRPRWAWCWCGARRGWCCCVHVDGDSDSRWPAHAPSCGTCPTARNIRKNWQPHWWPPADWTHCPLSFVYWSRCPRTAEISDRWPTAAGRRWTAGRRQSVWWSLDSPAIRCPLYPSSICAAISQNWFNN